MHVGKFLHKLLSSVMHQKRLKVLTLATSAAILTKKISVTSLGRGIIGKMQERSGIRQADRLVGNKLLYEERKLVYEKIVCLFVNNKARPRIIVDWSNIPNTKFHLLRAAIATNGRALTLYEEVHTEKKLGNGKIHNKFLETLCTLIDPNSRPIIVTDAGFHAPWFTKVKELGWDYVGRIRGTYKYSVTQGKSWKNCKSLLWRATEIVNGLGKVLIGKKRSIWTNLYLVKGKAKGRKAVTKLGKKQKNSDSKEHSCSGREPWLLASSLSGKSYLCARRVEKIYQRRMQIEEGFPDLKSPRYGLSFEHAFSRSILRISNLVLIATLSILIAWLIGWIGEKNEIHHTFQPNSSKNKRILSLFFLGCQMIKRKTYIDVNELLSFSSKGFRYVI